MIECDHSAQFSITNYGPCNLCGLNQDYILMQRIAALEKVAEAAEIEYREQYSYGHTSKDTMDALFDALDAAGYLGEGNE